MAMLKFWGPIDYSLQIQADDRRRQMKPPALQLFSRIPLSPAALAGPFPLGSLGQ
jgi:hypothetical protein